jgi:hypothetical protein
MLSTRPASSRRLLGRVAALLAPLAAVGLDDTHHPPICGGNPLVGTVRVVRTAKLLRRAPSTYAMTKEPGEGDAAQCL